VSPRLYTYQKQSYNKRKKKKQTQEENSPIHSFVDVACVVVVVGEMKEIIQQGLLQLNNKWPQQHQQQY
jgi:hypothetical protein